MKRIMKSTLCSIKNILQHRVYAVRRYFAYYNRVARVPTEFQLRDDWFYYCTWEIKQLIDKEKIYDDKIACNRVFHYWKAYHPKEAYQMKQHNATRSIIWSMIVGTLIAQYFIYFKFFWWLLTAAEKVK